MIKKYIPQYGSLDFRKANIRYQVIETMLGTIYSSHISIEKAKEFIDNLKS